VTPLQVVISDSAGFCWGVERALVIARRTARERKGPINTLGPLIHNPSVIADLGSQGIGVISNPNDATGTVILRSHGVARDTKEQLLRRGIHVVDATCRFVRAAQEKASGLQAAGYSVIIFGERDHPEVLGLRSYAGPDSLVVEGPEDLPEVLPSQRVGIVVQTTQSSERLSMLVAYLAPRVKELLVHNTICNATEQKQSAAIAMAEQVDVVIVVGGKNSANTRRLAELCIRVQPRTHHVESAVELDPAWFAMARVVGITAGASTPRGQIEAMAQSIKELYP